jgi:hypothetical protein
MRDGKREPGMAAVAADRRCAAWNGLARRVDNKGATLLADLLLMAKTFEARQKQAYA